jgi:tripartite-type tricarboxylate transporter receptor subunit TctC
MMMQALQSWRLRDMPPSPGTGKEGKARSRSRFAIVAVLLAFTSIVVFGAAPAAAQPVADFYRGKQLRMIIGIEPGTAYDLYARLVTRHMGKYIPGNPTIIPQNMPGAGSLNAYNYTTTSPRRTALRSARDIVLCR